eukprot:TRINITY_DN16659_c0_g1_i2.p2 TRINITY_DN16659_c0_g1~~TRINITY_DN16659_c0_g1_i2.p2  ORF type:complete len:103 (+),score=7.52 TRINITY_DN16659_c0_g1_i2:213-521(+)
MSNFWKVTSGDPRRPHEVRKYDRADVNSSERPPETMILAALVFGVVGLMTKFKLAGWLSVLCVLSSVSNTPHETADYKQMMSSVTFAIMAILACYLTPATAS